MHPRVAQAYSDELAQYLRKRPSARSILQETVGAARAATPLSVETTTSTDASWQTSDLST